MSPSSTCSTFQFDRKNFHFLEIQKDDHFEFYLLDTESFNAWSNNVKYTDLEKFSKDFQSFDIYLETVHKILQGKDDSNYIFSLKVDIFCIEEIIHSEDNIRKRFCEFQLNQDNFNVVAAKLLQHNNQHSKVLTGKIEQQSNVINEITAEKVKYQEELSQLKINHEKYIQNMFQSFLVLLNAKKKRIVQLYDIIDDLKQLESATVIKAEESITENDLFETKENVNVPLKDNYQVEEKKETSPINNIFTNDNNIANALLYENKKPNTCDLLLDDDEPEIKRNKIVDENPVVFPQENEDISVKPSSLDFDAEKFLDEL